MTLQTTPHRNVPVRLWAVNHNQHDVVLRQKTALGRLCQINMIQPIPHHEPQHVMVQLMTDRNIAPTEEDGNDVFEPRVDLNQLSHQQQQVAKEMLHRHSAAFSRDDDDTGCIQSMRMRINLKDEIPVQQTYRSVPKPLYQEVKDYLADLLRRGWINKVNIFIFLPNSICQKEGWLITAMY